jgi:4-amino-4-deoxy-L-arabinose transferase-like glycosyltransferase
MLKKIFVILALSYILFFLNLGATSLWDPDEPRQAIMAREMMERNDFVHPYLNGREYLEKPPLYPWMIIIASKATGRLDEFSSRVPAAISATLLLIITFLLGRRFGDGESGLLSAIVLATNYQFLSNARESIMDMTFAFFIGLTIFFNYLALARGRKWLFALSFLPASLAIVTKGPAGLVIPAGVIFICLLIRKEMKGFILPLILGCFLSLGLASIWFLLAGDAYIREFILRQNITRYMNAFDHMESFLYYLHKIFFNFLPWSILLPFALYHAFRKKLWLPLVWFIFTFLFFEFSTSKRAIYLLPCYPACALLCGIYMRDKWELLVGKTGTNRALKIFSIVLALIPIAAVTALYVMPYRDVQAFREGPSSLYIYLVILFLLGAALLVSLARRSARRSIVLLLVYFVFVGFFYNMYYMPITDRTIKSLRLITDPIGDHKRYKEIYTYGFNSAGLIFYLGRPIQSFADIKEIKDIKHDILLIVEERPGVNIKNELEKLFLPVKQINYEKDHYTIYVRRNG